MPRRVIKVGGSLLTRPTLEADLNQWLNRQPPAQNLIIFGGGNLIDSIRKLDKTAPKDPAKIHWQCVQLLSITFQFALNRFPHFESIDDIERFEFLCRDAPSKPAFIILDPNVFYLQNDPNQTLPESWDTTSDAIAALLAVKTNADELVLLKSCKIPTNRTHQWLADLCIVDAAFPNAAKSIPKTRIEMLPERYES